MKKINRYIAAGALVASMSFGAVAPVISASAATPAQELVSVQTELAYSRAAIAPYAESGSSLTDTINALLQQIQDLTAVVEDLSTAIESVKEISGPAKEVIGLVMESGNAIVNTAYEVRASITNIYNSFPDMSGMSVEIENIGNAIQACVAIVEPNINQIIIKGQEVYDMSAGVISNVTNAIKALMGISKPAPAPDPEPNPDPEPTSMVQKLLSAQVMLENNLSNLEAAMNEVTVKSEEAVVAPVTVVEKVNDPTAYAAMAIAASVTVVLGAMFVVSVKKYNN